MLLFIYRNEILGAIWSVIAKILSWLINIISDYLIFITSFIARFTADALDPKHRPNWRPLGGPNGGSDDGSDDPSGGFPGGPNHSNSFFSSNSSYGLNDTINDF